jgi:hypothetical protein
MIKKRKLIVLYLSVILIIFAYCGSPDNKAPSQRSGSDHPMSEMVEGFHLYSYYAGTMVAASEFVSYGVKKLALSPTFNEEQLKALLPVAEKEAGRYGIPIYVEKDLLVTQLFRADIAVGKTVIMFAYKQEILDEYHKLKQIRKEALEKGTLADLEEEIAWKFGRLLSYTDETIKRLIAERSEE